MSQGQGPQDDLAVHSPELTEIGNEAYELRTGLTEPTRLADESTDSAARALSNASMETADALTHTRERFEDKVRMLKNNCRYLEEHLGVTVASHASDEADIVTGIRQAAATGGPAGHELTPQARFLETFGIGEASPAPHPTVPAGGLNEDIINI
ncbi:hypothetical protein [Streptomyces sp. 7-21]|uniref:hypothetical protein n=1 Tax=Streptomyces sp. 7-21 TaxID=2802283 RepID=UPI00191D002D|nr:hypothetical protein [Streptomyces sp. 7-21]MBL1067511.1 hypothetical protein [Streptomyces sp. 7-21]